MNSLCAMAQGLVFCFFCLNRLVECLMNTKGTVGSVPRRLPNGERECPRNSKTLIESVTSTGKGDSCSHCVELVAYFTFSLIFSFLS